MNAGTWLGTALGYFGWVLGLAIVVIASGDTAALIDVVLPTAAVTLGLFGSLASALTLFARRGLHAEFMLFLFGRLAFDIGLLGLLLEHWILPRLRQNPANLDSLRATGSVTDVPWLLGWPLLTIGAILLLVSSVRLLRAP